MRNILEEFYKQIENNRWIGSKTKDRHGMFYLGRSKQIGAHVFSFILHNKRMPIGEVHHTCEDASCTNPLHLVELLKSEHVALHKTKKFCSKGHEIAVVGRTRHGHCRKCYPIKKEMIGSKDDTTNSTIEENSELDTRVLNSSQ